jgi:hypothetical protein
MVRFHPLALASPLFVLHSALHCHRGRGTTPVGVLPEFDYVFGRQCRPAATGGIRCSCVIQDDLLKLTFHE